MSATQANGSPQAQADPGEEFDVMGDTEDEIGRDVMGTAEWSKSFNYRLPLATIGSAG